MPRPRSVWPDAYTKKKANGFVRDLFCPQENVARFRAKLRLADKDVQKTGIHHKVRVRVRVRVSVRVSVRVRVTVRVME